MYQHRHQSFNGFLCKNLWKTCSGVHEMRDKTIFRCAKLLFKFHPPG